MTMKDIAKKLIDEIDGTDFKVEYSSMGADTVVYLWGHGVSPLRAFSFYSFVNDDTTQETLSEALEFISEHKKEKL